MREFERIRVEKGQAYIRETGITVSEVVTKYLIDKDTKTVLEHYSILENEDLIEALGYATNDLRQEIAAWCHEIMVPLVSVNGFSELLSLNLGTEEQRVRFPNTIRENSERATDLLVHFNRRTHWKYGSGVQYWQTTNLHKLINQIMSRSSLKDSVQIEPFDESISVKENGWLETAIFNLLNDWHFPRLKPEVNVRILNKEELIRLHIHRAFLDTENDVQSSEQFFWDGHPFLLARQIIEAHHSSLEVEIIGLEVTFEFSLRIWQENS